MTNQTEAQHCPICHSGLLMFAETAFVGGVRESLNLAPDDPILVPGYIEDGLEDAVHAVLMLVGHDLDFIRASRSAIERHLSISNGVPVEVTERENADLARRYLAVDTTECGEDHGS